MNGSRISVAYADGTAWETWDIPPPAPAVQEFRAEGEDSLKCLESMSNSLLGKWSQVFKLHRAFNHTPASVSMWLSLGEGC